MRPDFAVRQRLMGDDRPSDRILSHYMLERELSDRLRHAAPGSRTLTYGVVYQQLFASLPDHPQHQNRGANTGKTSTHLQRISRFVQPNGVFLEIGCGDAALAFAAAKCLKFAYGLDVTDALIDLSKAPSNFRFLSTTGIAIPLPDGTVDLAYSNQLMEHLHPDDAADQLREVHRVLKPSGRYICITPSRVSGPHDVSCYFDYEATGLHLKEYDYGLLSALFRQAGFRKFACAAAVHGRDIVLPYPAIRALESALWCLPSRIRAGLTNSAALHAILGLNAIAEK